MTRSRNARVAVEKSDLWNLFERVRGYSRPVVSLYATVHPGQKESWSRAVVTRVKNTLRELEGVPSEIHEQIVSYFERRTPQGRTVAVFASREQLESLELDLSVHDDTASDRLDARMGEPYFTPLLYAANEYAPHLVVFADRDNVCLYRVFLGQAEQLARATRETTAPEQDELGRSKDRFSQAMASVRPPAASSHSIVGTQQNKPKFIADRGDAARQLANERIEYSQASFYRDNAQRMQEILRQYSIDRVLVLGPDRDRHLMLSSMPRQVSKCVGALLPSTTGEVPSPRQVLELAQPTIEALEAERDAELLDAIADRGVRGLEPCLVALQEGRLHKLAVPMSLSKPAYIDPETEYVTAQKKEASTLSAGAAQSVDLSIKLPELAEKWGAHLEFVSGEQERRVLEEFGGMGGLSRW